MNNLHLLIIGNSEEEIRRNLVDALNDAFYNHRSPLEDNANAIFGDHWEYEFVSYNYMADILSSSLRELLKSYPADMTIQELMDEYDREAGINK